ncbi:hypothetical protein [Neorhizobium alkalisoli]|uniref:Uncharacterized protein n=1 Tax=Neorhizobium alkalisoli TaxID=528178 RepID=A0A561QNW2_9HYPH|nr:hypothetical protein [Neorhizobium alkalisoli]TWF52068.1 hypothetical protein FHW37_105167 [Neorhizobium alkalisoli]
MKIRLSKKFALILGGATLLCGGSGAAAVFVGADRLLGPSYRDLNGLECQALQIVKMKRDQRVWVRKYVTSDGEPADGMTRIRTALRVARAVQEKEKADIVQVAMIDKAGPTDRAQMRGRAIGAQVVYIPDPSKAPEGTDPQIYSAYYLDGTPTSKGEYYGMRIDLPLEDVEGLTAKLTDKTDCADPIVKVDPNAAVDPTKPKTHGKMEGKKEHGEGEAKGHGEAKSEGHGEEPAAEGHGAAPAEGHGEEVASKESGGFLSSITGMIFGAKEEAPAAAHGSEGEGQAAGSHDAPADGHAAPKTAEAHGDQKPVEGHGSPSTAEAHSNDGGENKPAAAAGHAEPVAAEKPAPAEAASDAHAPAEPAKAEAHGEQKAEVPAAKEDGGLFASVKSMIFGSGEEAKPAAAANKDHVEAKAETPAPAEKPAASDHAAKPDAAANHAPTAADAAGAAFLAKMRGQSAPAAATPVQEATTGKAPVASDTH